MEFGGKERSVVFDVGCLVKELMKGHRCSSEFVRLYSNPNEQVTRYITL